MKKKNIFPVSNREPSSRDMNAQSPALPKKKKKRLTKPTENESSANTARTGQKCRKHTSQSCSNRFKGEKKGRLATCAHGRAIKKPQARALASNGTSTEIQGDFNRAKLQTFFPSLSLSAVRHSIGECRRRGAVPRSSQANPPPNPRVQYEPELPRLRSFCREPFSFSLCPAVERVFRYFIFSCTSCGK